MADQTPATQSAMTNWQNDVNQTNDLKNTQLKAQQDRLNQLLVVMGQVPASVAFNLLIPAAMLMVSNQNTTDMEIEASKGNEESDILTLINLTQADNNYLASQSSNYQDALSYQSNNEYQVKTDDNGDQAYWDKKTDTWVEGPDGQPLTVQENTDFINDYNNTYDEANDAQNDLITIFNTKNSDGSSYYDSNYANSMIAAINSWQGATDDLSSKSTGDPAGQSQEYYYSLHMQDYAYDPSASTYATDVSNLTTSINTEQTSNNSMQSQIQGIIKALMTNAQQYEGSTKSAGASIIKEKDYWIQQQKSS